MTTAEILRRVRRVEIKSSRLADDVLSGAYHSVFKGRGMDFEELREYVPGDDVRAIDRNVTARTGKPFVKLHREERELTVILALDVSGSFDFGSGEDTKRAFAAEIAATLAFSAATNGDKVGLLLFTEDTELFLPPKKGRRHTLRLIREMIAFAPKRRKTGLAAALGHLNRMLHRRAVVFLFTDFLHTPRDGGAMRALAVTDARHDLVCVHIRDPREHALPGAGLVVVEDAETGELVEMDTSRDTVRERYEALAIGELEATRETMAKAGIDLLGLATGSDYAAKLRRFLDNRRRRA